MSLWPRIEKVLHRVEKPMRYAGAEMGGVARPGDAEPTASIVLAFPDLYEIGASYHGFRILHERINRTAGFQAERAYAPWIDFEREMRAHDIPLYAVESFRPVRDFDVLGFTLQHEMNYTTVLNMLDLAGLAVRAADRRDPWPLVIAGGEGALAPEPMAPFIDAFVLGDGEETILTILECVAELKRRPDATKSDCLEALARLESVYVPALAEFEYTEDDTIGSFKYKGEAGGVSDGPEPGDGRFRRAVFDLGGDPGPIEPVVPLSRIVHDRLVIEIRRGCARGCRFCAAGMINRHVRERPVDQIVDIAERGLGGTGYRDVSLLSLSSGDYTRIAELVDRLRARFADRPIAVSLPSLRISDFDVELAARIGEVRKTGFTFAPEAGSERLRRVINKPIADDEIFHVVDSVCAAGWQTLKFYFMIGLPTETGEDLDGIVRIVRGAERIGRGYHRGRLNINVTLAPFVPKPHTPFQWEAQIDREEMERRYRYVAGALEQSRRVRVKRHSTRAAFVEAVLARGDRRVGEAIERAWRHGCRLDAWSDQFQFETWLRAFEETGIDPAAWANRPRGDDEVLPWDHIDAGPSRKFLHRQREAALSGTPTADCTVDECPGCTACAKPPGHRLADGGSRLASGAREKKEWPKPEPARRVQRKDARPPRFAREQPAPVERIRLRYSKAGRMRFLSHLDMVKTWQLLVERAGLPVAYSRGFHPVAQLQYSPPLAVGYAGLGELVDVFLRERLGAEEVERRLNASVPEGMRVSDAETVDLDAPALDRSIEAADSEIGLSSKCEERHGVSAADIKWVWKERLQPEGSAMAGDAGSDSEARKAATQIASLNIDSREPSLLRLRVVRRAGNITDPRKLLERVLGLEIQTGDDVEVTRLGLVAAPPPARMLR